MRSLWNRFSSPGFLDSMPLQPAQHSELPVSSTRGPDGADQYQINLMRSSALRAAYSSVQPAQRCEPELGQSTAAGVFVCHMMISCERSASIASSVTAHGRESSNSIERAECRGIGAFNRI